jgi:PPOX class probable F420-dependent enzyme
MDTIDTSTEFGMRVSRRLREEEVIWMTTVGLDHAPHPRPVWFSWDGESFLIYSQPDTYKLLHIDNNPNVSLHFDSDGHGGDIVVFIGMALVPDDATPADQVPTYVEKYESGFKEIGMTPESFAASYSIPIRVVPRKLRGH